MKEIWILLVAASLVLAFAGVASAKPDIEGKEVSYRAGDW